MFNIIMLRNDETHILNLAYSSGLILTICDIMFHKHDRVNILAVDNTFPGICVNCKLIYDEIYEQNLEDNLRRIRSHLSAFKSKLFIDHHRKNRLGPIARNWCLTERSWMKLNKYRNLVDRTKKHE